MVFALTLGTRGRMELALTDRAKCWYQGKIEYHPGLSTAEKVLHHQEGRTMVHMCNTLSNTTHRRQSVGGTHCVLIMPCVYSEIHTGL